MARASWLRMDAASWLAAGYVGRRWDFDCHRGQAGAQREPAGAGSQVLAIGAGWLRLDATSCAIDRRRVGLVDDGAVDEAAKVDVYSAAVCQVDAS